MVATFEAVEQNDGGNIGSTTNSCNKPSGVNTGDLLMLIASNEDSTSTAQYTDNKTGWNFLGNFGGSIPDSHTGIFYRIADGTEGSSESITTTTSRAWTMYYIRFSGVDESDPIDAYVQQSASSGSTITIRGLTTGADNCLMLGFAAGDGSDMSPFTWSQSGWTERADTAPDIGSNSVATTFGTYLKESAGSYSSFTISASASDGWQNVTLSINSSTEVNYNATALTLSTTEPEPIIYIYQPTNSLSLTSGLLSPNVAIDINFSATVLELVSDLRNAHTYIDYSISGTVGQTAIANRYPVTEGLIARTTKQTGNPNL